MLIRPKTALALAGVCGLAFVALLVVAYGSDSARFYDAAALQGFVGLQRPLVERISVEIAHLGDPEPALLIAGALVAVALARRRPRHALAVPVIVAGASVTTELLKPLLAEPRHHDFLATNGMGVGPEAFPSGHATVSMSLALAAVLVAPPRLRPLVALTGGVFPLAVSYALLSLEWHFPSDVLGGYLVAGAWAFLAIAALRAADERWPDRTGRRAARRALDRRPPAAVAAGALLAAALTAGAGLALALSRIDRLAGYAERHTATALVAALIAGAAGMVLAGVTLSARRR